MSTYDIGLEHVSPAFVTKTIFTDVTQGIFEGDRIGTVGRNDDGKPTLLHLFHDAQEPDSGRVAKRDRLTFGMLDQCDPLDDNATIHEATLEGRTGYKWASGNTSREIVEALLGGMSLGAKVGSLSNGQRHRADSARLLLKDWDILALDEPTSRLGVITVHWLAGHLKDRWSKGQGALLFVTHGRWFLDEVYESMWEVHDGVIGPFEDGYSTYILQRIERGRRADVCETERRNLAHRELTRLSRGAYARSTGQRSHVKAARELIADVPPMYNTPELKQMATFHLGKQVVGLVDVTQIFGKPQDMADIDPDVTAPSASASRVDVVNTMYVEPQLHGSVEVAITGTTDPRLVDADMPGTVESAEGARKKAGAESGNPRLADDREVRRMNMGGETIGGGTAAADSGDDTVATGVTSAARKVAISSREILDDMTWLIGLDDHSGIVGTNGADKSTLLELIGGTLTPTVGHVSIGKAVKFAVLSQRLDELEKLGKYKTEETLSHYRPSYTVGGREVTPEQLMERLGFESAQLMAPIRDLSGDQKRCMQLLLILLDEPNVFITDEPGNDPDTDVLTVMEDLLDTWPGTLIVVSRDRYPLERVTDQQLALVGSKVHHLPGGVQDYLDMVEATKSGRGLLADIPGLAGTGSSPTKSGKGKAAAVSAAASLPQSASRVAPSSEGANNGEDSTSKLTGKAFHEASKHVSTIECKLAKLEEQKVDLEARMAAHDPSDYGGLNKLNKQLTAVNIESGDPEAEWLELSEQLE